MKQNLERRSAGMLTLKHEKNIYAGAQERGNANAKSRNAGTRDAKALRNARPSLHDSTSSGPLIIFCIRFSFIRVICMCKKPAVSSSAVSLAPGSPTFFFQFAKFFSTSLKRPFRALLYTIVPRVNSHNLVASN